MCARAASVVPAHKIEPLTVAELNQYVVTADSHGRGDKYSGQKRDGVTLGAPNAQRNSSVKFLLSLASSVITDKPKAVVTDQTDDGVFVAFDTEIARLTNIQAAEAAQILVRPPMNHIKLAYANHFLVGLTVSRIITEHERAHLPAFVTDIVPFTSINPKYVRGRLFLNAASGTHIYFNCETAVGKEQHEKLAVDGTNENSFVGSRKAVVPAHKIEPLTVVELNQYVVTADSQYSGRKRDCVTLAAPNAQRNSSMKFLLSIASSVITDKPKAVVTDQTDDGVFVAFDTEIARLTNIQAAEAAQILVRPPMNHIKLAYANHFLVGLTVSRIITEHERAHLPAFVNDVRDKIEATNIPPGDNGTRAELGDCMTSELGEETIDNNQPSSSVVTNVNRPAASNQKHVAS
ncbi:hypothetical protein F2Q69_00058713 [Brassica cretica]|uniref:Uncharacterized protein n=1 Tax=Brassica cretica TaxID=69181 RepID=A0A8S9RBU0_BRACR|nr:hypothetical protein F2Q69_00058713 [Brassica cretica]